MVEEVRPDTIVTFGPDGVTGHEDHRAGGRRTTRARTAAAPGVELLRAVLAPGFTRRFAAVDAASGVFVDDPAPDVDPGLHLRLEGDRLDRKTEDIPALDSQTRRLVEGDGLVTSRRWWAEEAFPGRSAGVRASGPTGVTCTARARQEPVRHPAVARCPSVTWATSSCGSAIRPVGRRGAVWSSSTA